MRGLKVVLRANNDVETDLPNGHLHADWVAVRPTSSQMASSTQQTVVDPLWRHFGLTKKYRGTSEQAIMLPSLCEIGGEIEKFIIRQPPEGEKDDYDSENSWISDGLPSSMGLTPSKRCGEACRQIGVSCMH